MKPISKSKRQLAQQLIEAGVTQFPEGANWAAQDKSCDTAFFIGKPRRSSDGQSWLENLDTKCGQRTFDINNAEVYLPILTPNWHQTVLSRDEFDRIVAEAVVQDEPQYCESVMRSIPEPTTAPTLDQLLHDWRNADDYAQRKQTEADEAAVMRDERWQVVQARAGEMGVTVGRCESVVTADVQSVKIGDEITATRVVSVERLEGRKGKVLKIDSAAIDGPLYVKFQDDGSYWVKEWHLARP